MSAQHNNRSSNAKATPSAPRSAAPSGQAQKRANDGDGGEGAKRRPVRNLRPSTNVPPAVPAVVPFEQEKELGLHYPGKKYVLNAVEKGRDPAEQTAVERILAGNDEKEADWNTRATEMEKKMKEGEKFEIDFIVGCTKPTTGEWADGDVETTLLIVYKGFSRGEWVVFDQSTHQHTPEVLQFVNAQKAYDVVEALMRKELAARRLNFDNLYPARYLPAPETAEQWATSDSLLLRTLQAARQHDINKRNREDGAPPLFVADWRGDFHDYATNSLFTFKFSNYPTRSNRVERALKKGNLETIKIEFCDGGCPCTQADSTVRSECKCSTWGVKERYECSDRCKCGRDCANRVVQRGRQVPLLLWRHHVKGWTTRVFEDVDEGSYVHEYSAELVTYFENKEMDNTYSMEQAISLFDTKRETSSDEDEKRKYMGWAGADTGYTHRVLVSNGLNVANEARFDAHGCRPNQTVVNTFVDSRGLGLHRAAFFANRHLRCGEELTWNYHGEALAAALKAKKSYQSDLLPACDCGEEHCPIMKFKKEEEARIKKAKEQKPKKAKEASKPKANKKAKESLPDYDSFPDSDEEDERKKKRQGKRKERQDKKSEEREMSNDGKENSAPHRSNRRN